MDLFDQILDDHRRKSFNGCDPKIISEAVELLFCKGDDAARWLLRQHGDQQPFIEIIVRGERARDIARIEKWVQDHLDAAGRTMLAWTAPGKMTAGQKASLHHEHPIDPMLGECLRVYGLMKGLVNSGRLAEVRKAVNERRLLPRLKHPEHADCLAAACDDAANCRALRYRRAALEEVLQAKIVLMAGGHESAIEITEFVEPSDGGNGSREWRFA